MKKIVSILAALLCMYFAIGQPAQASDEVSIIVEPGKELECYNVTEIVLTPYETKESYRMYMETSGKEKRVNWMGRKVFKYDEVESVYMDNVGSGEIELTAKNEGGEKVDCVQY